MDVVTLPEVRPTRVRYLIIAILFAVSCFSFGDRVALSLAGAAMGKAINLTPVRLGYLFSAFSWAYVLGQLPSGGLLDRFGSRRVYGISIILWSICAFLTGFAGYAKQRHRAEWFASRAGAQRHVKRHGRTLSC
jgi:ACS family glucarate transporter-like MFS transporter